MNLQDIALIIAGLIGSGVAVVHGVLVQRLMVARLDKPSQTCAPPAQSVRKLMPLLLHFSTFNWFVDGLALISAAVWLGQHAKFAVGLLVASSYFYGGLANLWATRGRHPGWILYALAVILIVLGVVPSAH